MPPWTVSPSWRGGVRQQQATPLGSWPRVLRCHDGQVRTVNEDDSSCAPVEGPPADDKRYPDVVPPMGSNNAAPRSSTWRAGREAERHLTRGRHTPRLATCTRWRVPWLWRRRPCRFRPSGLSASLERPRGHPHSPYLLLCDRLAERPRIPPGGSTWFQPFRVAGTRQ